MPATKSHGASACHALTGTWKANAAAASPIATNAPWRARKYHDRCAVCADDSAIAIDAE